MTLKSDFDFDLQYLILIIASCKDKKKSDEGSHRIVRKNGGPTDRYTDGWINRLIKNNRFVSIEPKNAYIM